MSDLLPNQERARWVVIIFYINIAFIFAFAAVQWWQAGLIESGDLTTEMAEQSDTIVGATALVFIGMHIVCIIVFIMWFRRAYANLHRLGSVNILSYSEGWAAGAWFIPFINLVRPFTIMIEIWNGTQTSIPGKVEREGVQGTHHIGLWWGTWIAYNILSNIAGKLGGEDNVEEIVFGLRSSAIGATLALPAALLAIRMVQRTNDFEQELYETRRMSDPMEHLVV